MKWVVNIVFYILQVGENGRTIHLGIIFWQNILVHWKKLLIIFDSGRSDDLFDMEVLLRSSDCSSQ